jgi:DNA end-binding protein Ku
VILFNDTIGAANRSTHAVDIFAFIEAQEIPFDYFETPYTLAPAPGGEKLYAMLRETLRSTRKIGIAYVVIQARPHLAVLLPQGEGLVLNTLRWASEGDVPAGLNCMIEEEDMFHRGDDEMSTAERIADSMADVWYGPAYAEDELAELQVFPDGGQQSASMADMFLDDSTDEDDDFEDAYLAAVLQRSLHRPTATGASRAGRGAAAPRRASHAARTRVKVRRN